MALKTEAMGLAIMVELPLVICDIQRGGPSTGLPTKTEQADLLQAMFGRNSEAPIPVLAPSTPGDCFWIAVEAKPHRLEIHDTKLSFCQMDILLMERSPGAFQRWKTSLESR